MSAVLLGLASALCWGTSDFLGGMEARRMPPFAVVLWGQMVGGILLAIALAFMGTRPVLGSILWGGVGGVVGACALVLLYRGLATGLMSIVAPVSGCGVVLPVLFSIALGHVPQARGIAGIVAAVAGIVLVSLHPSSSNAAGGSSRSALVLALGAACGFGLFFVCVSQGTAVHDGSPLWTVAGARMGSLVLLPALVALRRASAPWPGRRLPHVALVGILDSSANLLYAIATTRGALAIVAVLGSLYPVATILLGQIVLSERLSRIQGAGVVLALLGVALLSAG
ncbi:MAG: DMT family transporter [Chloroflexota bacterium]